MKVTNIGNLQTSTRIKLVNKILNYTTHLRFTNDATVSKTDIKETKHFLKENQNLLLLKSDKGNTTVLVDRDMYNNEVINMLNDNNTYKVSKFQYTSTFEKEANSIVNNLVKKKQIDERLGKRLKTYNAIVPRAYALPKTHKSVLSWRIIVSSIGGPTYKLSKFLAGILSKIIGKSPFHTVDSWQFVKEIRTIVIPEDSMQLVSLDVTALFTNVPIGLALEVLDSRWDELKEHTTIKREEFIQAVKFVLEANVFMFNGTYYKQVFGTAMGSPISPVIANLVMEKLEQASISKLPFELVFYKRYVDDVITCLKPQQLQTVLDTFNSFHDRIQFTHEIENDSCLSFLDVSVLRDGNKLRTNWFHKTSWSGRYVNFHSHHPLQHKIGLVKGLIDRAILLANPEFRSDNLKIIKDVLRRNGYPVELTSRIIKKRIVDIYHPLLVDKRKEEKFKNAGPKNWKNTVVVPYVENISEDIRRIFRKIGMHTIYKIPQYIKTFFPPIKDKLPLCKNCNVVYLIPCKGCSQVYIGQTSRLLETRIKEHKRNIF
ncbi:uncharacterized protein LOC143217825 [Lasioglossum baleicum]|uniref:uncharacterized protein LOC143217825 n=1 Tax=Lasioglossum baleicum TaxID=434251 RepID=UPI003FCEDD84